MSAGGARRGRRDNGLRAADYAVAGDVDPRVGEHLLDVLAAGGIAAYLQPSADLNPVLRATTFPARPTDRLYVDSTHLAQAREQLDRVVDDIPLTSAPRQPNAGPGDSESGGRSDAGTGRGGRQSDIDAEWARIIAGFHTDLDPTAAPWPAAEGLPVRSDPTADPDSDPKPEPPADPPPRTGLTSAVDVAGIDANRWRGDSPSLLDGLDAEDDERYVPPPPPPLPTISKYTVAGALAVLVGFLLFLFPTVLPIGRDIASLTGFAAVLSGAVTLVWRLRSGRDDDESGDGAVV